MKSMGKILVIHGSDFSHNRIEKVDITEQVEKIEDNQTTIQLFLLIIHH